MDPPTIRSGIPDHLLQTLRKRRRSLSPSRQNLASSRDSGSAAQERNTATPSSCFTIPSGQPVEDERFQVYGEEDQDGSSSGSSDEEDEELWGPTPRKNHKTKLVPNRILRNFTFFDPNNGNNLLSLELLAKPATAPRDQSSPTFSAFGDVYAYVDQQGQDDDIEDFESQVQRATLPKILDMQIEYGVEEELEIWVGTQYAWYLLAEPSEGYRRYYFSTFWPKHQLLHQVIRAVKEDSKVTRADFVTWLVANSNKIRKDERGSKWKRTDVDDLVGKVTAELQAYALRAFDSMAAQRKFLRTPLVYYILEQTEANLEIKLSLPATRTSAKTRKKRRTKPLRPIHMMPISGLIAERLFDAKFTIEKSDEIPRPQLESVVEKRRNQAQYERLKKVMRREKRSGSICVGDEESREWVELDGVRYHVGDFVLTPPPSFDASSPQALQSVANVSPLNKLPSLCGFMRIMGFHHHTSGWKFHGRILRHGLHTVLQDTAHSRELFFTEICSDFRVAIILQTVQVDIIKEGEDFVEPAEEDISENERTPYMKYFVRYLTSPEGAFLPLDQRCHPKSVEDFICSCMRYRDEKIQENPLLSVGGNARAAQLRCLQYKGYIFRETDYVYVAPSQPGVWRIGQILSLKQDWKATVRWLGRHEELAREANRRNGRHDPPEYMDPYCLYMTSGSDEVHFDDLISICHVQHKGRLRDQNGINLWTAALDGYYVSQQVDPSLPPNTPVTLDSLRPLDIQGFTPCGKESEELEMKRLADYSVTTRRRKRTCMDLFCGAGGLSLGFENSGLYTVKWGLDITENATETFQSIHPHAHIFNQEASRFLDEVMKSEDPSEYPRPGEVDLIAAGPPCQDFSGLNRFKSKNDQRKAMVAMAVACVEYFKPKHFLIENVVRIVYAGLGGGAGQRTTKHGVHKFILRSLTALGYNIHWKIYQAGHFGVPQNRERVIYVAAKRGEPFPLPLRPTHALLPLSKPANLKIPYYDSNAFQYIPGPYLSRVELDLRGAAHYPITVNDAIGDLPMFDWKHRHPRRLICPLRPDEKLALRSRRTEEGIPAFSSRKTSNEETMQQAMAEGNLSSYKHLPINAYQVIVRQAQDPDSFPIQHITRTFSDLNVERIMRIPLGVDGDHRSLPIPLQLPGLGSTDSHAAVSHSFYPGLYGRVDSDGFFKTVVTDVIPSNKQGRCLHPNQLRVLTVRECARAQGFPDHVKFISTTDRAGDMHRQIGNAVPVPLSRALAESFRNAFIG